MELKEWTIPAGGEFRFEIGGGEDATTTVRLLQGQAEVFGVEMAPYPREYTFTGPHHKLAIFSYTGATVGLSKACQVEYVSQETPLPIQYLNTHLALEQQCGIRGRTVMILGTGRTSLTKTLANYAVRAGALQSAPPILVDLSLGGGGGGGSGGGGGDSTSTSGRAAGGGLLLFPGTLSALLLDRPGEVELAGGGWGAGEPDPRGLISFFYGHWHPQDNPKLYWRLVGTLGALVQERQSQGDSGDSGCCPVFILMPADPGEALVAHVQASFGAGVILVVGNERLHSTLSRAQSHAPNTTTTTILKLPKSGGVVTTTATTSDYPFRRASMQRQFKAYFYGPHGEYTPFSLVINLATTTTSDNNNNSSDESVTLWKLIGEEAVAPASALPLGATRRVDETRLVRVDQPSNALLLYAILAVVCQSSTTTLSSTTSSTSQNLLDSTIAGYVYVTGYDEQRRQLTVLSPCPGRLPSSNLLVGAIKWIEN